MTDATTSPALPADDLPRADRRAWLALVTVCAGMLMIVLDGTIVNVALPEIQDDLGFSQSTLTWLVNAYLISYGSFLLIAGRLGDIFGRKRMFLLGLIIFVGASMLCGLSGSQVVIIAGRFIQGLGGALASASVLAIIVTDFQRQDEQTRAMGVYTVVAVAGGSIGLLLGGVITQYLSWHWIFFINVPIGIVTYLAGVRLIDESEKHEAEGGIDITGAALATIAVAVGVYAIVDATNAGWLSLQTLGLGAIAIAGIAAFLVLEGRVRNPIMPLSILRVRALTYSNLIRVTLTTGMIASFFFGALFMERAKGYDAIEIGFAFLPLTVAITFMSLGPNEWIAKRFGTIKPILVALPFSALSLLLLATADQNTSYFPTFFGALTLLGLAGGAAFTPLVMLSMRDVREADAGLASGLVNVSMQLGGAIALAVLGSVSTERTQALIADGTGRIDATVSGFQLAYYVAAAVVLAGIALTLVAAREPESGAATEPTGDDAVGEGVA